MRSIALVKVVVGSLLLAFVLPGPAMADPAAEKIFFSRTLNPYDSDSIFAMTLDGSSNEEVAVGTTPSVSPDGFRIAFSRYSGSATLTDIFVSNLDGTDERRVVGLRGYEWFPSWSPDGKALTFHSYLESRGCCSIYTVQIDGSKLREIARGQAPSWSPRGDWIAYSRFKESGGQGWDLWAVSPNGDRFRQLSTGSISAFRARWSPDARSIAVQAGRVTTLPRGSATFKDDIYIVDVKTGAARRLTFGSASETYPCWSPDGTRVAFSRAPTEAYVHDQMGGFYWAPVYSDLFVIEVDGTNEEQLTFTPHTNEYECDWTRV